MEVMAHTPLPGAREEGESIARQIAGAVLLTGRDARKDRLAKDVSECAILHIATHGYADPDYPEFSGLLLAATESRPFDVLTAAEVSLWSLKARLVTLSACQSGLGQTVEGEGLLGLTRSFLFAGAGDVVCSLWSVSDKSTSALMRRFYASLMANSAVETALTEAQRELLENEETRHPFFWAAFVPVRGLQ